MNQHKKSFYDTRIGRILIGVSIFITGNLTWGLIILVLSSAQPQKCKLENSEIRQMIIEMAGVVSKQGDMFHSYIVRSEKKEAVDSTRYFYIMRK